MRIERRSGRIQLAIMTVAAGLASCTAFACTSTSISDEVLSVVPQADQEQRRLLSDAWGENGVFPISRGALCTFAFAGQFDEGFGGAAIDHGQGRVTQTIVTGGGCSPRHFLVVSDCQSAEFLIVHGDGPHPEEGAPRVAGLSQNLIEHHLVPEGPIDAASGIDQLMSIAETHRLNVTVPADLEGFQDWFFSGDEIRPLCGCSIYYPDSPGASG